ncbi:MAG: 30S ribosome-binding factor RbfA [Oceanicoccus sp.]|uniref:30S ribosome-binding factor RbfA n=1 Tax=Oceanicoccus sp. TaxID=2691044 RepID=UPI00261EA002|nr:30S ribosome-binding factor RbfA [Oceanicoccus sp.]MCP3907035.1 30S ribosome-binding factor RbfA [Oceanicoccus sp.]MDG1772537.1 30S ribosome-binding factor RbfA [Oceanicoccus sp.]
MAKEYSRTQRVGDFLKQELASLIQFEVRDPRVGMVSITDVEVSRDMSHAKVFMTVLGKDSEEEASESIEVLNKAAGFLRTQIAKNNNARTTPRLRFYFDSSVGRGQHLSNLIDKAVSADKAFSDDEKSR